MPPFDERHKAGKECKADQADAHCHEQAAEDGEVRLGVPGVSRDATSHACCQTRRRQHIFTRIERRDEGEVEGLAQGKDGEEGVVVGDSPRDITIADQYKLDDGGYDEECKS